MHCSFPELKAHGISSGCPELFVNLNILVGTWNVMVIDEDLGSRHCTCQTYLGTKALYS